MKPNCVSCPKCRKRFENSTDLEEHMSCHSTSCVCHLCGATFKHPNSLKSHMSYIHCVTELVCHFCAKTFRKKHSLELHMQSHTGQYKYTCHLCGRGSATLSLFSVHLATHTDERPYKCSMCPKTFKHTKYVYLHERSVHHHIRYVAKSVLSKKVPKATEEERTCPYCGKLFKSRSGLSRHKISHESVHQGCDICGRVFRHPKFLESHRQKVHFPEQCQFVCDVCGKRYSLKGELQKHMRRHTTTNRFVCLECDKEFATQGCLNIHNRARHSQVAQGPKKVTKYMCSICNALFSFRSQLVRHMASHSEKYALEIQE